jgi:hypothetical protein
LVHDIILSIFVSDVQIGKDKSFHPALLLTITKKGFRDGAFEN